MCPSTSDKMCLNHQQLYDFKKEEHANTQWATVLMPGDSVRCNPLESPVNSRARGTVCRQFVLSDHCVMYVSLPVWTQMSSSFDKCASLSDSIISSVMSQSVRFHLVSTLLNALRCNSSTHQTQRIPNDHDSSICTAWPVTHVIALTWDGTVELWIEISVNLQFKKVEEVLTAE
jgi:hypothetical protein